MSNLLKIPIKKIKEWIDIIDCAAINTDNEYVFELLDDLVKDMEKYEQKSKD